MIGRGTSAVPAVCAVSPGVTVTGSALWSVDPERTNHASGAARSTKLSPTTPGSLRDRHGAEGRPLSSPPGPCAGAQSFLCVHPAVAQLHERGSCVSPAWTIDTAQLISFTLTLLSDFFSQ